MQFQKAIAALVRVGNRRVESFCCSSTYCKRQYHVNCQSTGILGYAVNGRTAVNNFLLQKRSPLAYIYNFKPVSLCTLTSPILPEVTVNGTKVPEPIETFEETNFDDGVILELQRSGFTKPTTIQAHCLPVAISGRDIVGIGQTGSGKTLAYILPALLHISKTKRDTRERGPKVLVMAPTRELAQQIQEVALQFGRVCGVRSTCVFGGVAKYPQIQDLRRGVDICIGTPGRLIDHAEMGDLDLSKCSYLVLDEADRMLDMGFEPQIRRLIHGIPSHQTLMWSATWPKEIRTLASDFLKEFVQITVGSSELRANPNIKQTIQICSESQKEDLLMTTIKDILENNKNAKVLVFAQTKREVDDITRMLVWKQFSATCIHGNKTQLQRDIALKEFRDSRKPILVATDVAARGLDITDISDVINYAFPNTVEDYVHRIGRTARGQRSGTSHTFFTMNNGGLAKDLVAVLQKANQTVHPELLDMARSLPYQRTSLVRQNRSNSRDRYFKDRPNSRDSYGSRENYRSRDNFRSRDDYGSRDGSRGFGRNRSNERRDNSDFHDDMDNEYSSTYSKY